MLYVSVDSLLIFPDRTWSNMQIKIKWFPMPLFNLFLLLNNLILFYWFLWFSKKCLGLNRYICVVCLFFFCQWISWFPDLFSLTHMSARLQKTSQDIFSDWKTLDKTSRQIYKLNLALNEFSQSTFSSSGGRLSNSNDSFIVYCTKGLRLCQLPSVDMSLAHRHQARKKPLRNPLVTLLDIRTSYCALTRRRTITIFSDTWVGFNASYQRIIPEENEKVATEFPK